VLPLEFKAGENRETLGLTGHEIFEIEGICRPKRIANTAVMVVENLFRRSARAMAV